jgi:hypothetical protein
MSKIEGRKKKSDTGTRSGYLTRMLCDSLRRSSVKIHTHQFNLIIWSQINSNLGIYVYIWNVRKFEMKLKLKIYRLRILVWRIWSFPWWDDIDVNFLWLNRAKKEENNVIRKSVKFEWKWNYKKWFYNIPLRPPSNLLALTWKSMSINNRNTLSTRHKTLDGLFIMGFLWACM